MFGDVATFITFISIPGAAASARRQDYLVAQPGTVYPASHPMAPPAASRSALASPSTNTLSPIAPDIEGFIEGVKYALSSYFQTGCQNI